MRKKRKKNKNIFKSWGQAFLLALLLALLVKGFVMESFRVANRTMEKTIFKGDYIFVNKLKYGARLPITLLSVPFTNQLYWPFIQLPDMRLPGYGTINRNDFLVFNYPGLFDPPVDKRPIMVKRCIGLPGDKVQIKNKKVWVNDKEIPEPQTALFNYRLVTDGTFLSDEFLNKYHIAEGGLISDIGVYDFPLLRSQTKAIKKEPQIRYLRELKHFFGENTDGIFPQGKYHHFNKDYFGYVIVPYKGMRIKLHAKNIEHYKLLITQFEGNSLLVRNNRVYINGIESDYYTVKSNYYFVLDDNRDYAKDSRYFGYVPENHVIGNAVFTWFSYNNLKGKIRWHRIFKRL